MRNVSSVLPFCSEMEMYLDLDCCQSQTKYFFAFVIIFVQDQPHGSEDEQDFAHSQQDSPYNTRQKKTSSKSSRSHPTKHSSSPIKKPRGRRKRSSGSKRSRSPSQSDDDSVQEKENRRANRHQQSPTLEELARRNMAPSKETKLKNANAENKALREQLAALQAQIGANGGQVAPPGGQVAGQVAPPGVQVATNGGQAAAVAPAGVQFPPNGGQALAAAAGQVATNGVQAINAAGQPINAAGQPLNQYEIVGVVPRGWNEVASGQGLTYAGVQTRQSTAVAAAPQATASVKPFVQDQQELHDALYKVRNGKLKGDKKRLWGKTQIVIREAVKDHFFRRTQFIPNNTMKRKLTIMILDHLNIVGLVGNTPEIKKARDEWIEAFQDCVMYEFNETRVYVNGQVKDHWFEAARRDEELDGDGWPTLEELEACFNRTIDINTPRGFKVMEFYWDVLLPKAPGNTHGWSEERRHYTTIMESKVTTKDGSKQWTVTPSVEAFMMLCIKNNYKRWKLQYKVQFGAEYKQFNGMDQCVLTAKKYDHLTEDVVEEENYTTKNGVEKTRVVLKGPSFRTLYTSDKGQKAFHGWSDEGRKQLKADTKIAHDLRKGEAGKATLAFEKKFLELLRAKLKLTKSNKQDQQAANKRARMMTGLDAASRAALEEEEEEEMDDIR